MVWLFGRSDSWMLCGLQTFPVVSLYLSLVSLLPASSSWSPLIAGFPCSHAALSAGQLRIFGSSETVNTEQARRRV